MLQLSERSTVKTDRRTGTTTDGRVAILAIAAGGSGVLAAMHIRALHDSDNRPFPLRILQIDTDQTTTGYFDQTVPIGLDEVKIDALRSNPNKFGPIAARILQHYADFLHPEDVGHGSRTVRALTQLSFLYHKTTIRRALRQAIIGLKHEGSFEYILPVIFGSSGGGAGSALLILFPLALQDPSFRQVLTEGFPPATLRIPIGFVVEPFAYAEKHHTIHANKILGKAFAFRAECAAIERRKAYKYVFHLGLANEFGTVLDRPAEVARVLGTSVYQFQRHWADIKPRYVDTVDVHVINGHYQGEDTFDGPGRSPDDDSNR